MERGNSERIQSAYNINESSNIMQKGSNVQMTTYLFSFLTIKRH